MVDTPKPKKAGIDLSNLEDTNQDTKMDVNNIDQSSLHLNTDTSPDVEDSPGLEGIGLQSLGASPMVQLATPLIQEGVRKVSEMGRAGEIANRTLRDVVGGLDIAGGIAGDAIARTLLKDPKPRGAKRAIVGAAAVTGAVAGEKLSMDMEEVLFGQDLSNVEKLDRVKETALIATAAEAAGFGLEKIGSAVFRGTKAGMSKTLRSIGDAFDGTINKAGEAFEAGLGKARKVLLKAGNLQKRHDVTPVMTDILEDISGKAASGQQIVGANPGLRATIRRGERELSDDLLSKFVSGARDGVEFTFDEILRAKRILQAGSKNLKGQAKHAVNQYSHQFNKMLLDSSPELAQVFKNYHETAKLFYALKNSFKVGSIQGTVTGGKLVKNLPVWNNLVKPLFKDNPKVLRLLMDGAGDTAIKKTAKKNLGKLVSAGAIGGAAYLGKDKIKKFLGL